MISRTRDELISTVNYFLHISKSKSIEQLYNCKAWIIKPEFSDLLILQSYSTVVAAYQFSTGILWVFGFYSHTTVQHVAKFRNWIRYEYQTGWNYQRTVKLYNDSKTGKRAARKNLDDDFASVIAAALNQQ